ncbi:hypothetical protein VPH35_111098 [Triticum aestivum]
MSLLLLDLCYILWRLSRLLLCGAGPTTSASLLHGQTSKGNSKPYQGRGLKSPHLKSMGAIHKNRGQDKEADIFALLFGGGRRRFASLVAQVDRPVPRESGSTRSLATCCGGGITGSAPGCPGHAAAARAAEWRPQRRCKSSSFTSTSRKTSR